MRTRLALFIAIFFLFFAAFVAQADNGSTPRYYTVKAGDTLGAIASTYGVSVTELLAANALADPNFIDVGQRLRIPGGEPGAKDYRVMARRLGISAQEWQLQESLPAPFEALAYSPTITQGQTGVVSVVVDEKATPTGTYDTTPLHFYFQEITPRGYQYRALIPVPALAAPGERTLTVRAGEQELQRPIPIIAGPYATESIILPPGKGGILSDQQKLVEERARLGAVWAEHTSRRLWRNRYRFPIGDGFQQTSPYGTRRSYNGGPVSSFHEGSDWGAPEGTPLLAPAPGVVALADELFVRGGAVIIDHGQGVFSNFWHLSRIDVTPGQSVEAGEQIGLVGTTGLSTGAHLHWELRVDGLAVDPLQWTTAYFPYLPTRSE